MAAEWLDVRDAERLLDQGFPRRVKIDWRVWSVCEFEWNHEYACFSRVGYRNGSNSPSSDKVFVRLTPQEITQGGPEYVRTMVAWTIENAMRPA